MGLAVLSTAVLSTAVLSGCGRSDDTAAPATTAPVDDGHDVTVRTGIEYGTAQVGSPEPGLTPLLLDLYLPSGEVVTSRPIVVVIHGGGFTKQSRTDDGIVRIARALAERGIVAASIDYRLIPQAPVWSDRLAALDDVTAQTNLAPGMLAAIDDTLTAIDYLAANADELGIDMARLGLIGSSAGAITADHVAYALDDHGIDGPDVAVVGSLWGGILIAPPDGMGDEGAVQLGAGEAALFAVHGDADDTVPVALSDELVARAEEVGVANDYVRIPGGGHGFDGSQFFTYRAPNGQGVDPETPFDRMLAFVQLILQT